VIKVKIVRSKDGSIRSFTVKGHAFYADPGKDIVCAGVSAITVGTVNAIEALTGAKLVSRMEDGFLQASVPELPMGSTPEQVQLLLESMVVMLRTIQESYGGYIAVRDAKR
jgi:uncharacterized protein YsxB (DUF464 family)